jgi:hypothetical protein
VGVSSEVAGLVRSIAQASKEQSIALEQVTSAVAVIDQSTQKNAQVVQEAAEAATGLRREAASLTELVQHFVLEEAEAGPDPEPSAEPAWRGKAPPAAEEEARFVPPAPARSRPSARA